MRQLKFDEIIGSIESGKNKYEEEHDIKTLKVYLLERKDNLAFFLADKSDNSKSLYFAIQPDKSVDHWVWCCPNEEHIKFLTTELSKHIGKYTVSQNLTYTSKMVFSDVNDIVKEIQSNLGKDYKVEIIKKGDTTLLIAANNSESHLFIAVKPSKRFGHWYLFFPSLDQIQLLIKDLSRTYTKTDSKNELTRGS